ncbi:ATP-binding protein [Thermotomaculum hydrothermale]|uniref:ATP-binding protein n=1 Tax=Thermotomaculum hydrothermale TaxID=981385 RepID=UPI0019158EB6|nr:biotin carboxylase N-terminal domain-containing protein [Thermotomaculum hydrothermale]
MSKFKRVLIANRGEIAKRIYNALRDLDITPVIPVVEKEYNQCYTCYPYALLIKTEDGVFLDKERLIEIAKKYNCQAIHPGYGFLAENADFARLCEENGIIFIGPPANSIELMGHKETARVIAEKSGVSPVPGFSLKGLSEEEILNKARGIGFPVLIKASLGGGGKGMRRVDKEKELFENIRIAKSESKEYFASDEIFVEKYIVNPRHIEIQIFSFPGGRTVYLGERECTIQRRHQKIIEESPSPIVDDKLRKEMGGSGCCTCRYCFLCWCWYC